MLHVASPRLLLLLIMRAMSVLQNTEWCTAVSAYKTA